MHRTRPRTALPLLAALGLLLLATGCGSDPSGPDDDPELEGGVLATFVSEAHGDVFRVFVTDGEAIEQLLDLQAGRSTAGIPVAPILRGPGVANHNAPWPWHLDGSRLEMAEFAIEVCDGRPAAIEDDLDYWVDTVGSYCPWGVELTEVRDFR